MRLLLITPVHNEAVHIERVVRAMAAQTRPPDLWVVVDDGSTDETLKRLRQLEPEVNFLRVIEQIKPRTGRTRDRLGEALEARAFNYGLSQVDDVAAYDFVGKLDGDVELPPEWFETLLARMERDPELGVIGGTLIERERAGWRRLPIPEHHVHGAVKIYRRDCFAAIGGVHERLAWDTIDETYARLAGYRTHSYRDVVARHLRPAASADGQIRGRARHGECAWILHYPLGWVVLRSLKVALDQPRGISGLAFLYGYIAASRRGVARVPDRHFRRFTRAELRARMRGRRPAMSYRGSEV